MADRSDLEAAAVAGVINAEQVAPLHEFLVSRATGASGVSALPGEENLRFIRNFHDVFLAIGILLFAVGLAIGIGTYVAGTAPDQGTVLTGALCLVAVVIMWGLGELFARRRRLFLPAIAIVCSMTIFAVVAVATLYAGALLGRDFGERPMEFESLPPELHSGLLISMAFAFVTPLAFYFRFRLPFSLGLAGSGIALFVIVACMIADLELTMSMLPALYLVLGGLLFLAGVVFDARDPARVTRFSDNGFWLHFAAAPLILNGAFGLIGQVLTGDMSSSGSMIVAAGSGETGAAAVQAIATLFVIVVLGLVSLLINRRALIVSALLTAGIAIGALLNAAGLGAGALAAATLITLGAFVLILGAGWHGVRRALLGWVKPDGVWARIFPPEQPATA